ncbi:DEAD/DEAH box helicase [Streptacidiphilus rugosus]|uniref:DEAD/DEAH box helicase n=1 Tax=Streptacidiphilus rugosus TaxID=405783 RepID=UPI000566B824|nr:DEAD/DEAH box helicase [Streptacidiphilus rugosus]
MFALHGLWRADRRLALWAEDAARPSDHAPAEGRHPFACPPEALRTLLGAVSPGLEWLAGLADEDDTRLLLPTLEGRPLPSPELAFPAPRSGPTGALLTPWRVPSLLFDADEAAQLLGALHDPERQAVHPDLPGLGPVEAAFGASLRWLTALHDLAWRLVGRGRVLPVVEPDRAVWRPAPGPAEARELAGLTAACPPVARAEAGARRGAAGLADELLAVLVDREARACLTALRAPAPTGPAECLVAALVSADGRLTGAPADRQPLAEALGRLLAAVGGTATAPLRLGFRLVEPQGEAETEPESEDRWWLELVMNPAEEPSQLVTAAELWAGGPGADVLAESMTAPHAAFALELTRAARCHRLLARLAEEARAQGLWLDRADALLFLREAAPVLTEAGFLVLLPSWWREPPALGMLLAAHPAQAGVVERESLVGRDEMLAFQWQLALGGEPLTGEELAHLAAAKGTLVRIRGHWLVADADRLAAAAAFLDREGSGSMAAREVLELVLDAREPAGLPVIAVEVGGRLRALVAALTPTGPPPDAADPPARVELPASFTTELRPYQRTGVDWLASLSRLGIGAVLADDMGLGKTVQTLALLAAEYASAEPPAAPTLVVVPMSLLGNWERECDRFAPGLRVHVHHGAGRGGAARIRQAALAADLVLTTYGLAARDVEALRGIDWHRVVADEAQNIKNAATLQSRAVRALPAAHRIALTGTPVENRLAELHSILDFANPGLFGTAERFKERYSVAIERNASVRATALLRQRTAPFVLRRRKTDPAIAAELPRKQEMTVLCNLTAEQAALYRAVVAQLLQRIKGMGYTRDLERRGHVLAALTRLKQICNHPAHFTGEGARGAAVRLAGRSGKLARLEEILEEALAEGDSTLCFTQYAQFGALLQPYLQRRLGCTVRFLHGGVPERSRRQLVDAFQDDDHPSVFLLSLKAGGTGLNLTAANQVVHVDRWWNPAVEEQATDRAHRLGQQRDVQVRRLVCVGTIEERVDELLTAKRALVDAVIGAGSPGALDELTALAPEALREVLTLAEEAVSEL